jgi:hypothetical protein
LDWTTIKQELYFEDGSLRDIIADVNISQEKCKELYKFLQINYNLQITCDGDLTDSSIDKILHDSEHCYIISFYICQVHFQFYLNLQYVEFDFSPNEVDCFEMHTAIIYFMTQLANILQVSIKMTPESCHDMSLYEIFPEI